MTDLNEKSRAKPRAVKSEDLVEEIKELMSDQLISIIYRDRIRSERTRRYELNAPAKTVPVEIMHTLLGIELKVGKRRLLCPDLSTARYLAVFARLGVEDVAVPYDITKLSRLADDLEASWFRMLMLADHLTNEQGRRFTQRVRGGLVNDQRREIIALGSGPPIPQFNQNTKQRRPKN